MAEEKTRETFKTMVFEVTVEFKEPVESDTMDVVEEEIADRLSRTLEGPSNDSPRYNVKIKDRRVTLLELSAEGSTLDWWERPLD